MTTYGTKSKCWKEKQQDERWKRKKIERKKEGPFDALKAETKPS